MFGTVKWFNEIKGYGFINGPDAEAFVHVNQIVGQPKAGRILFPGDEVEFDQSDSAKGPRATNVKVVKRMPRVEVKPCSSFQ